MQVVPAQTLVSSSRLSSHHHHLDSSFSLPVEQNELVDAVGLLFFYVFFYLLQLNTLPRVRWKGRREEKCQIWSSFPFAPLCSAQNLLELLCCFAVIPLGVKLNEHPFKRGFRSDQLLRGDYRRFYSSLLAMKQRLIAQKK